MVRDKVRDVGDDGMKPSSYSFLWSEISLVKDSQS